MATTHLVSESDEDTSLLSFFKGKIEKSKLEILKKAALVNQEPEDRPTVGGVLQELAIQQNPSSSSAKPRSGRDRSTAKKQDSYRLILETEQAAANSGKENGEADQDSLIDFAITNRMYTSRSSLEYSQTKGSDEKSRQPPSNPDSFRALTDFRPTDCLQTSAAKDPRRAPLSARESSHKDGSTPRLRKKEEPMQVSAAKNSRAADASGLPQAVSFTEKFLGLLEAGGSLASLKEEFVALNWIPVQLLSSFPLSAYPEICSRRKLQGLFQHVLRVVEQGLQQEGLLFSRGVAVECLLKPHTPLLMTDVRKICRRLFGSDHEVQVHKEELFGVGLKWLMEYIWTRRLKLAPAPKPLPGLRQLSSNSSSKSLASRDSAASGSRLQTDLLQDNDKLRDLLSSLAESNASDAQILRTLSQELGEDLADPEQIEQMKILVKNLRQMMNNNIRDKLMQTGSAALEPPRPLAEPNLDSDLEVFNYFLALDLSEPPSPDRASASK
jgi:hypothetical protein